MSLENYLNYSRTLNDRSLKTIVIIKGYTIFKEKGIVIGLGWLTQHLYHQKVPDDVRQDIFRDRINLALDKKVYHLWIRHFLPPEGKQVEISWWNKLHV